MDYFETIRRRRSVRRFTADPVKEEDLMTMLEAARIAPSSHNAQPWRFIVIRNPNLKATLRDAVSAVLNAANPRQDQFYALAAFDAPVLIAALAQPVPSPVPNAPPRMDSGLQSVSAALAQLYLAAVSLGYGGCWTTLPLSWARPELEALLEVEAPWFTVALLSIGVPAKMPKEINRKSLEEIVTFR